MRPWRRATAADPAFAAESYALALCTRCGTAATLGEKPPPVTAHSTTSYGKTRSGADRLIEPLRRAAERDRMRELRSLPAGARVLEVGSGDGRFLRRMAGRGWGTTGIEPSAKDFRASSPLDPSPVLSATVEEARFESACFDAVVLWHSLEHLEDPSEVLGRIHDWLSPGGLLVIGVPNLLSLQARLGGDRWFHQDVPRHRTHFSPAGLRTLLERAGFELLRERHLIVEQNALGMWQTLLNRLTGERDVLFRITKGDRSLPRRDRLVTALLALPLAPVALLVELAAGLARRGGSIAMTARRSP